MATRVKLCRAYRSWKMEDSEDPSDVNRLYQSDIQIRTKSLKCRYFGVLSLLFLGLLTLFLFGLFLGYYISESRKVDPNVNACLPKDRRDGFSKDRLESVHENIMYYMSGERAADYVRKLGNSDSSDSDSHVSDLVEQEFWRFGMDKVEVEKHQIVVTYPDPNNPNRLEVISHTGITEANETFTYHPPDKKTKKRSGHQAEDSQPVVLFSPSGKVQGELVFGYHGRHIDFLHLQAYNVTIRDSVVLLRIGKISLPEMVQWAEEFGARGVLLYDADSSHTSDRKTVSVADFTGPEAVLPSIPVQMVTAKIANRIMVNYSDKKLPAIWRDFLTRPNNRSSYSAGLKVKLEVYTTQVTKMVKNVVGTIYGTTEADRYILIGASHSTDGTVDSQSNTAMLLEMANSLTYIRQFEKWRPRRALKLISWGGQEFSSYGLNLHLKMHKELLKRECVAYFELQFPQTGSDVMKILTSPSLMPLVRKMAGKVPDPRHPELMVVDTWPAMSHNWYLMDNLPLRCYHGDYMNNPLLHQLGIPTFHISFLANGISPQVDLQTLDLRHHFKHHIGSTRVVSRVVLGLVDDIVLPFNVSFYTSFLQGLVMESVAVMKQLMSTHNASTESLLLAAAAVSKSGENFTNNKRKVCAGDDLSVRMTNDVQSQLERALVAHLPQLRGNQYLFSQDQPSGTLTYLNSAIDEYILTHNTDSVRTRVQTLKGSLQQVLDSLNRTVR